MSLFGDIDLTKLFDHDSEYGKSYVFGELTDEMIARAEQTLGWFCQYHLTHFIRTRIMQRERYDHSRAFFWLPEADHRWRCRFFCWPSNS